MTSKRVAVALCAAVAMVLGAMSVGATMHLYGSEATVQPAANRVSPSTMQNIDRTTNSKPKPTDTTKQVLTPLLIAPPKTSDNKSTNQKPTLVKPDISSQTSLTLGPLEVSISTTSDDQLQIDTPLTPPITIQTTPPVDEPTDSPTNAPQTSPSESAPSDDSTLLSPSAFSAPPTSGSDSSGQTPTN